MALVFAHRLMVGGMDGTGQYRCSMDVKNHLMLEVADDTKVASNMRGFLVFPGATWTLSAPARSASYLPLIT
jgi:hypothetical protein